MTSITEAVARALYAIRISTQEAIREQGMNGPYPTFDESVEIGRALGREKPMPCQVEAEAAIAAIRKCQEFLTEEVTQGRMSVNEARGYLGEPPL